MEFPTRPRQTFLRSLATIVASVAVTTVAIAAPAGAQAIGEFEPYPMAAGDTGNEVNRVQTLLNEYLALSESTDQLIREDGLFGPDTTTAVDALEAAEGLTQDSILTRSESTALQRRVEALTAELPESVVREGAEGPNVETWQIQLNDWLRLTSSSTELILEDGLFGPNSTSATNTFEAHADLQIDGIVEPADRSAMRYTLADLRDGSDLPPLKLGDAGNVVENTQDLLNSWLALSASTTALIREDGVFGPSTEAVALELERASNLRIDGVLTRSELVELRRIVDALEEAVLADALNLGDTGAIVESWQTQINDWIFFFDRDRPFVIENGQFGQDTEGATRAFEGSVDLQVDGLVEVQDSATMRAVLAERRNRPGTLATATSLEDIVSASDYDPDIHGEILRLYPAFFNREADPDGARYWVQTVYGRNQQSVEEITGFFSSPLQPEFVNFYSDIPHDDNEAYLRRVYNNVLRRIPDQQGFDYWLELLDAGELDRGGVVRWIALNQEFIDRYPYRVPD